MSSILFLGDSVTDCSRKRAARYQGLPESLGDGWVSKVGSVLQARPQEYQLFNRGYAGCQTHELMSQLDWWPEQLETADIVSVMIGVNDVWMPFWRGLSHNIDRSLQSFDELVRRLSERAKQVVICEPVALPCGEVTQQWWSYMDELAKGQRALAAQHGASFLPLQDALMSTARGKLFDYMSDGVHPTYLGHHWISKQWLSFVSAQDLIES
ncbi:SGNH/GDSL hydrolase family protein [Reinekea marinisedimentorum]|uniref:Lysophospholipase L1-like esterase n=1 Tax=Reinekea marinisedimentorum TaxID=230495 RepID=A0A4R3I7B9_9GAMM|nr:GDSL-type esterase/lipase family protein [Reinekea marinisedimentorum]TCS42045.1 lysophospholipase L1-like esterase [Reinekea marinisedimentorum]